MSTITRRSFVKRSGVVGGGGWLRPGRSAQSASRAAGQASVEGYGPLVTRAISGSPEDFDYQIISRQGTGDVRRQPTPESSTAWAPIPAPNDTTILIRNHENRERRARSRW